MTNHNNISGLKKGKPFLPLNVSAKTNVSKISFLVGSCAIVEYVRCDYQASEERTEYYLDSFYFPEPFVPDNK